MALRALHDHRRSSNEDTSLHERSQGQHDLVRGVGRIDEYEIEHLRALQAPKRLYSVAPDDSPSALQAERLEVRANYVQGTQRPIDQNCVLRPPGKRLDRKRARPGVQIENATASKVTQPGEECLANSIRRRAHTLRRRRQPPAAQFTSNDTHGAPHPTSRPPAEAAATGSARREEQRSTQTL